MSKVAEVELKVSKEENKKSEEKKNQVKNSSDTESSSESSSDESEKEPKKASKEAPKKQSAESPKESKKEEPQKEEPIKPLPKQWKIDDVCDWLKTINLGDDYTAQIKKAKIDGEVLLTMTTQDFSAVGFAFGDARKAEMRVKSLKGGQVSPVEGRTRANTRISYSTLAEFTPASYEDVPNLKTGWLEYKGLNLHVWKKKYFILEGNEFRFYNLDTDISPQGIISLVNAGIFTKIEKENGVCKELFAIRTPDRDWLLRCFNEKDKAEWVQSLKAAIVRGNIAPRSKSKNFLRGNSFFNVK